MKITAVLLASTFAEKDLFGLERDSKCTAIGGQCLDWRYYICTAGYVTGKCNGDNNRKCCQNCDSSCLNQEAQDAKGDSKCDAMGGKCMHNSNYCKDSWHSGKCGGSSSRQCCAKGGSSGGGSPGMCGNYGCVVNMDTTGCSGTCNQDGKCSGSGVSCSGKLASNDFKNLKKYQSQAKRAGSSKNIDHCIIGSIISRESRAGAALQTWNGQFGWGDCHGGTCYGFGLMQIDRRYHTPKGAYDSQQHLEQATQILIDTINCVARNHKSWTQEQQSKGGISGYNAGCGNVQTYDGMDIGTTGNDYANDCVARGQWFRKNGF